MRRWLCVARTGTFPCALSGQLRDPPPWLFHVVKHDIISLFHPPPHSLALGVNPEHLSTTLVPFFCCFKSMLHGGTTRAAVLATVVSWTTKPPVYFINELAIKEVMYVHKHGNQITLGRKTRQCFAQNLDRQLMGLGTFFAESIILEVGNEIWFGGHKLQAPHRPLSTSKIIKSLPVSTRCRVIESHIVSYSYRARSSRAINTKHFPSALIPVTVVKVHLWTFVRLAVGGTAKPVVPYARL